jgi:hypothetical protein
VAEIYLYEIGLARSFWLGGGKNDRITTLYSCLMATKRFVDTHFSSSSVFPPSHAYFMWIFSGYVVLIGLKLSVCDADGWDTVHAREVLNFPHFIDIVAGKLEKIVHIRSSQSKSDIFTWYLRQMLCIKLYGSSLSTVQVGDTSIENRSEVRLQSENDNLNDTQMNFSIEDAHSYLEDLFLNVEGGFWDGLHNGGDWMMSGYQRDPSTTW